MTERLPAKGRRKDRSKFPVETTIAKLTEGDQVLFVAVIRDISKRRRAEQALAESEERYRSIVTAIAEGIVLQDAEGRIIACNQSAERILGLSRDQMMGLTSFNHAGGRPTKMAARRPGMTTRSSSPGEPVSPNPTSSWAFTGPTERWHGFPSIHSRCTAPVSTCPTPWLPPSPTSRTKGEPNWPSAERSALSHAVRKQHRRCVARPRLMAASLPPTPRPVACWEEPKRRSAAQGGREWSTNRIPGCRSCWTSAPYW